MSYSTEQRWVPQNLSQFQDVLHLKKGKRNGEKPSIYGLPIFNIFYSKPKKGNDGIVNRLTDNYGNYLGHKRLHAFRIIVGCTWNWAMANIAGYHLSKDDLDHTITSLCRQCARIKKDDTKLWKWNELLGCKANDPCFKQIMDWHHEIILMWFIDDKPYKGLQGWFKENLSFFAIQKEAKITLIPITIQKAYIDIIAQSDKITDDVKQRAIDLLTKDFQKEYSAEYTITKDQYAWSLDYNEETIRKSSFMLSKTAQRTLSLTKRNSKKKHGRTHAVNSHP